MAKSEQFTFDEGDNKKKDMKMKNNLMVVLVLEKEIQVNRYHSFA